ncbi:hypothetical protein GH714_015773 [Hevea brasiliensis]|uniref:PRONE domain-containing protein n=1 Tax=Hevea brasiliensis TaxID=3981 RepID=A0A6A6LXM9_HEVBR|nr:hypothetical protein GH714_015773 [Hevea brasiliensis]
MVVNNIVFCDSPQFLEEENAAMEGFIEKNYEGHEEQSHISSEEESSSPPSLGWPIQKQKVPDYTSSNGASEEGEKLHLDNRKLEKLHLDSRKLEKRESSISETEMMKERFSKLLLGEDMSGCGNGVCTALAISNAITNLCATLFGQLWRLEPLPTEKKAMWRREMEWLLCVSDHIVELIPSWQTFPDGSKLETPVRLYINLPALRKLDNMLLEILDSFDNAEFWYVDQGILAPDADGSSSFRRTFQRQEEKWWLPVPRVPPCGLHENSRKQLQHKRDCTNQILKAAMAINSIALADMEVPESYLEALPKNGKASLGDLIYRYISSDQFSPECLFDCLDLSSEHQAIELANRVEASIYVWRKRTNSKPANNATRSSSKSSWELDVGKSILESYSRVLESLAFNIIARIDDLLYVDDLTKHSDQFSSISKVGVIAHKSVSIPYSVPVSSTPYKTAYTTPSFSPGHLVSPVKGERSSFTMTSGKIPQQRGLGVKKVLTD